MPEALRFPSDIDLDALRKALWAHRIGHHYARDREGQMLWLIDDAQRPQARALIEKWQRGETIALEEKGDRVARGGSVGASLGAVPLVSTLLALCLLVFALQHVFDTRMLTALAIAPVTILNDQLYASSLGYALSQGEIWRLFSPAFLHFSPMHLIFNLLWLWFFGRQVELLQGRLRFLALLLSAMAVANLAQYATGTILFGGMSGVVYALVGFVWIYARLVPQSGFQFPQMLVFFMIGWLVLCMTPAADWLGFGNVANEAHLGGLLLGLVAGWLAARFPARRRELN